MAASELLLNVFFYLFAAVALGGAVAVATSKNIVRSAFSLLAVLFAVAAMYAFMRADFIVVAQIIIYVGGILVLIIFAVMLTHKITDVKLSNESAPGPAAFFGSVCVFVALLATISIYRWDRSVPPQKATVAPVEGRPAYAVELTMTQGDGRTGVMPGHAVLDGFVRLHAVMGGRFTAEAKAKFRVDQWQKDKKEWKEFKSLVAWVDSQRASHADFERLPAGPYRWSVRFEDDAGATPWIPFAAHAEGDGADFKSEDGLTHSLGLALAGPYLLPFELVSVLLLAALVGAAFLARKEVKE